MLDAIERTTYVTNSLNFMFNDLKKAHDKVVDSVCLYYNIEGFKHNNVAYTYENRCVLPGKLPLIPTAARVGWEDHISTYHRRISNKEKVRWALAQITTKAKDLRSMYALFPESIREEAGIYLYDNTPDCVMSSEELTKAKKDLHDAYVIIEAHFLTQAVLR